MQEFLTDRKMGQKKTPKPGIDISFKIDPTVRIITRQLAFRCLSGALWVYDNQQRFCIAIIWRSLMDTIRDENMTKLHGSGNDYTINSPTIIVV